MNKILVILGPTSTGKTDLALRFAKRFNGELISCDSRQVYRGLDIGTGKAPGGESSNENKELSIKKERGYWNINGIKIWMYNVADYKKQYTVFDYVKDANKVIEEIRERGRLPIIVGGTGLYLKALLEGLPNLAIPMNLHLRKKLEKFSLEQLQEKLQELAPNRWQRMNDSDKKNPRRLVRAIEIATSVDINITAVGLMSTAGGIKLKADILKIGLTASRGVLYQRIDKRVVDRINQGMVDEAKKLHKEGLSFKRMKQLGLEYGVLADFLKGKIAGEDELVKIMQGKIHGFARRQITWFKNPSTTSGHISWFDILDQNFPGNVEKMITKWYYQP